jgi:hypothetical protein
MTRRPEPNNHVMLNLGLMKIRLVSASRLFLLPSAAVPFILVRRIIIKKAPLGAPLFHQRNSDKKSIQL